MSDGDEVKMALRELEELRQVIKDLEQRVRIIELEREQEADYQREQRDRRDPS